MMRVFDKSLSRVIKILDSKNTENIWQQYQYIFDFFHFFSQNLSFFHFSQYLYTETSNKGIMLII